MKFFSVAALLTAIASTADALMVNTPTNVVQCQPILITWDPQGSAGPFFLSVHPGDNPTGPAIVSWDNLTGSSFTWIVTVSAGQNLGLLLRDTSGATSQSAPFTVQAGSTDCSASSSVSLPPGSSVSSVPGSSISSIPASSTPTPTPTPTPTITPITTSTRPPSSASTPTTVRSSTTSSPAPTATGGSSTGGALSNAVNFGSAGFLAALVGAVLA